MTDVREQGLKVFQELLPDSAITLRDGTFGDELAAHVKIARTNGLSEDEIAEVIYHASGYAGFPAANTACKVAREALRSRLGESNPRPIHYE